jgi:phosphatidylglycerophosphate synthase
MDKALDANNFVPPPSGASAAPGSAPAAATAPRPMTLRLLKEVARKGGAASSDDPFWLSRLFYRRFTVYVTWLCIKLGIGSNAATLLSAVAIFGAALCYVAPSKTAWLVGALLVQVYFILDHVDGELARYETVHLGRTGSGTAGVFYDTCCHAGELALVAGIGLRLFANTGGWWWVGVVLLLTYFPGSIMPWQRYCEAVVAYARKHVEGDRAALAAEMVRSSSYAWAPAAGQLTSGRLISAITQTVGFPGYFVTLLVCTILDVAGAATPSFRGRAVSYLLIWLTVRAVHSALAALKSVRVYGQRLATLR